MEDGIAMVIFTGITIGRRGIIIGIIYIFIYIYMANVIKRIVTTINK